ncbi:hypothetical protein Tco_1201871 [Tanacetum coccineum]
MDLAESSEKGRRTREGSQNSSADVSPVRYHTSSRRPRVQDRLRYNDGNVFNRLSRQRRSVHERLSDTYSPSMTRSRFRQGQALGYPSRIEGPRTKYKDPLETDVRSRSRGIKKEENAIILHINADLKAAPVTRAIGSQEIKGARRWRKTWPYLGVARIWIRLHIEFATSEARGRRECPTM